MVEILDGLAASNMPADRFIREFFRARRYAGSKDRASVSERVFQIYRHRASYTWRMGSECARSLVIASLLAEDVGTEDVASLFSGEGYGPPALTDEERAAIAHPPEGEPPLRVKGEFPAFLEGELVERFGDNLLPEMQALTHRAPVDLRVNTLKATRDEVLALLRADGYAAEPTRYSPLAIRLASGEGAAQLARHKAFNEGLFEFQDEAAQIAALLCDAKPGQSVLDLAAGAGGKSLALAALMENKGEIVATDLSIARLNQIAARAARAGATIIHTNAPSPPRGERVGVRGHPANDPKHSVTLTLSPGRGEGVRLFDVVLVDAPCSGSGTWRRQPEQKWRLTEQRLGVLRATQDTLLDKAAGSVAPGGRLVYATCSLLPSENERRIAAFLDRTSGFAAISAATIWRERTGTPPPPGLDEFFRATPYATGTDGFFTAVLTRA